MTHHKHSSDKSELWNFTTTAANYFQELKNGIQALMQSSVAGLPGDIEALAVTANARFEFIETWRKQMLPETYPRGDTSNIISDDAKLIPNHAEAWNVAHFKCATSNLARAYIDLRELAAKLEEHTKHLSSADAHRLYLITHANDL